MKSKVFLIVAFILCNIALFAQREQHRNHESKIEKLKSELDLSTEQTEQWKKIQEDHINSLKELKEDETLEREEMKIKYVQLMKDHQYKIESILDEQQLEKLKSLQLERKAEMKMKRLEKQEKMENRLNEMRKYRAEFDENIQEEDRKQIAELRTVFKAHRKHDKMKNKRYYNQQKAKRKAFAEENKEEMEILKSLSEKYDEKLKEFFAEKNIQRDKEKRKSKKGMGEKNNFHFKRTARFLLLEPIGENTLKSDQKTSEISVYPNPARDWITINYKVRKEGPVNIQIVDENGNTIKSLLDEKMDTGEYELEVNISELKNKNYFIVVKDSIGINSKKVLKLE